jgi:hypothetical protein
MLDILTLKKTAHQKRTLFLLGGHDLEMLSIKNLLIDFGFEDITESHDLSSDLCFADKEILNTNDFKKDSINIINCD